MRVLIVQRSLSPPGGGNAVAAWMVQALSGPHQVATLTAGEWSVSETNAFYGTSIDAATVRRHVVPAPWRWLSALPDDGMTRLRMCSVLHYARPLASEYDLMITADNFAAFAKPGIQYVHFPAMLQPEPARFAFVVNAYFQLCDRLMGAPWMDAVKNLTLANSQWTAEQLTGLSEVARPIVLHPPVLDSGPGLPWAERDDRFLCIGRFHPSKRIETSIAIVKAVRGSVLPQARLSIVGSEVDAAYFTRLRELAAREGSWIEFLEDLSRPALNALIGRSRYGIQAMEGEHFGMATAEMTRAGCLVFAHNSGGSPEVLNHRASLLWTSVEEAIDRIVAVTASNPSGLSDALRAHARKFSPEMFAAHLRRIVAAYVS